MADNFKGLDYRVMLGRQAKQLRDIAQTLRDASLRDRLERLALDIIGEPDNNQAFRPNLH